MGMQRASKCFVGSSLERKLKSKVESPTVQIKSITKESMSKESR